MSLKKIFNALNIFGQCKRYRIKLWQCPQFLFVVMGLIIIAAVILSNVVARYYTEPEIAALIVLAVATLLFIIGHTVVSSFQRLAETLIAQSEFISIASHQLRSPLTAIRWQLDLLSGKRAGAEFNQGELQSSLDAIEDQNHRMMRIVGDLLELNRIENNELKLNPGQFSLKEIVENTTKEYQPFAAASNITLKFLPPPDFPSVFADMDRIKNVVRHFFDNAIRYSRGKSEIVATIEKSGSFLRFSIADEGIGVSKEEAGRVFTKFFRSQNAPRYQTEGTGIGLYLAKMIVEASGGSIGFSSIEGKGSTFWFTLPISEKIENRT